MVKRINLATAIGCIALSLFVIVESLQLEFYTKLGPGPGFFPLILGAIFGFLGLVWLVQIVLRKKAAPKEGEEEKLFPDKGGKMRILMIVVSLLAVAALMEFLGYQISMFLFMFFLVRFQGKRKTYVALLASLVGSVGIFYLFGAALDVQLPASSVPFLARIGL